MKKHALNLAFASALVLLFLYFVYPTRYHYTDYQSPVSGSVYNARIDRLSGKAEILTPQGWETIANPRLRRQRTAR